MKNKWTAAVVCGIFIVFGTFSILYASGLFSVRTADEEKKTEIARILDSPPFYRERAAKIAKGELPEDQPRMTEEQARAVISKVARTDAGGLTEAGMNELIGKFNVLHGAPDYTGGSGMDRMIYILSEAPAASIMLMGGIVTLSKPDPGNPRQSVMINLVSNEVVAPPSTSPPAK